MPQRRELMDAGSLAKKYGQEGKPRPHFLWRRICRGTALPCRYGAFMNSQHLQWMYIKAKACARCFEKGGGLRIGLNMSALHFAMRAGQSSETPDCVRHRR